ncbi:MAG: RdgB/HAM1 family non-canonical purine NTP pyrophosphatase [Pyrinomonadaceae bacterium]|nr:RdgB/HAM1 family non-canonical purine NTP pyrophosphatase [Pyrinomonadaceae bacterium]
MEINKKILLATRNRGKVVEFQKLLEELPFELISLEQFSRVPDPVESGATFEENAVIKAVEYAAATGLIAIADDSGLEVNALGGAPGVYSARFAGEDASDTENLNKLLSLLEHAADRSACFTSVIAVADPKGLVLRTEYGICEGKIVRQPLGTNGFGYDPVFVPEGYQETFGQLSASVKHTLSHRAKAARKIIHFLREFTAV